MAAYFLSIGISRDGIQQHIDRNEDHQLQKPVFSNCAELQPVEGKAVMERLQVDLVNLSAIKSSHPYVLVILDLFSRFMWLRPLNAKGAEEVACEMTAIWDVFGNPRLVRVCPTCNCELNWFFYFVEDGGSKLPPPT